LVFRSIDFGAFALLVVVCLLSFLLYVFWLCVSVICAICSLIALRLEFVVVVVVNAIFVGGAGVGVGVGGSLGLFPFSTNYTSEQYAALVFPSVDIALARLLVGACGCAVRLFGCLVSEEVLDSVLRS
jgi:hypothetical protein